MLALALVETPRVEKGGALLLEDTAASLLLIRHADTPCVADQAGCLFITFSGMLFCGTYTSHFDKIRY